MLLTSLSCHQISIIFPADITIHITIFPTSGTAIILNVLIDEVNFSLID